MNQKAIEISVFGARQICSSCVQLPSSMDTFEWLEAAVRRKYPDSSITFSYIDIEQPPNDEAKRTFAKKVIEEDLFYPVVVIEGSIVGEGNVRLKSVFHELEKYGYTTNN
jgi:disulfide oxidoreductase YuzD